MTDKKIPKAPAKLGARGGRYWRAVHDRYELGLDETELLVELCRTLDLCEALEIEARERPMIDGRYGQSQVNPAIKELRQHRLAAGRLAAQIGLPTPEGEKVPSPATLRGRSAAQSRWAAREVERGA